MLKQKKNLLEGSDLLFMESAAMKSKWLPPKRVKKKALQSWITVSQWLLILARQQGPKVIFHGLGVCVLVLQNHHEAEMSEKSIDKKPWFSDIQ